jgi:hypothetical protein
VLSGVDSAAATLFMQRAGAVAPGISLAGAEAGAVIEICSRLDGIPLAIELAASRMASMTASEVRDRLDHRFRLLVGSRRGLERHQTLRHAVAWSYDLLGDAEKALLDRCSVFSGGFDLESACAVAGSGDVDDFDILDLLDALVRKSLLVADRSAGQTRFSMLETIRQFAEEQLAARGQATETRIAHARYFAAQEADVFTVWDSPRQREAYEWFTTEFANLRSAFRWAADHGDLDVAAPIATYAALLGLMVENYEPIAWAEELIEPARSANHPKLASLYLMATQCWMVGRIEDALRYGDAGQALVASGQGEVPLGLEHLRGTVYQLTDQPERWVQASRDHLEGGRQIHFLDKVSLVNAFVMAGLEEDAIRAANDLIAEVESVRNPYAHSMALLSYGFACRESEPLRALEAMRRGLVIAHDSRNRYIETHLTASLARLEAQHGDPRAALEYLVLAIGNYHNSGNTTVIRVPMAFLAGFLHRLGRHEPAATIAGYAVSFLTEAWIPELNNSITSLREVLGDQTYESLARTGRTMTTPAMVAYAYDQIDQARAELNAVLK